MTKYIYIVIAFIFVTACSPYQKAMKSPDLEVKNDMFTKLIEKKKYNKAIALFESFGTAFRGNPKAEESYYKYAVALYKTKQYISASYQYESFAANYIKNPKVQEAAFYGAEAYSHLSNPFALEQVDTDKAIEKMQAFIDKYPDSEYMPQANGIMKVLTGKLERKAFEIAKQYNSVSEYRAALKALDNFILDYPGTPLKEEALFLRYDSAYQLAVNSVPNKKQERLLDAKLMFNNLTKYTSDSPYMAKANKMLQDIEIQLKQYNN
jgi:outer membrane protein assembly factor BamD